MFWQSRRHNTLGFSSRIQFQNSGTAGLGFYQALSYKAPVNLLWAYTAPDETHTESPGTWQDHLALFKSHQRRRGGKKPNKIKLPAFTPGIWTRLFLDTVPKKGICWGSSEPWSEIQLGRITPDLRFFNSCSKARWCSIPTGHHKQWGSGTEVRIHLL